MTDIVFTGDVAFSQYFKDAWRQTVIDGTTEAFLRDAGWVAANVEGPVTDRPIASDRLLNHANAAGAAGALRAMHMNVWCLANNHILDCGGGGLDDTLAAAHAQGAVPLGASGECGACPRPVVVGDECRVGLLALADGWPFLKDGDRLLTLDDERRVRQQLRDLRARADYVVAVVHAGREYTGMALPPERRAYRRLLRWGADVVVGHHPHVVQHYEQVGKKLVFYSLGNFLFDTPNQRRFPHTDQGVLLRLRFSRNGVEWQALGTEVDRTEQRVRAAETVPPIFRAVSRWDYGLLWPLAAAVYRQNQRVQRLALYGEPAARPAVGWLRRKLRALRSQERRTLFLGKCLARLGLWRLSRRRELADWLMAGAAGEKESGT